MKIARHTRVLIVLLLLAAITAHLAQAQGQGTSGLNPTKLPCWPNCPSFQEADSSSASAPKIVVADGFDWHDAGIGAGLGIALVLTGLIGTLEVRKLRTASR